MTCWRTPGSMSSRTCNNFQVVVSQMWIFLSALVLISLPPVLDERMAVGQFLWPDSFRLRVNMNSEDALRQFSRGSPIGRFMESSRDRLGDGRRDTFRTENKPVVRVLGARFLRIL